MFAQPTPMMTHRALVSFRALHHLIAFSTLFLFHFTALFICPLLFLLHFISLLTLFQYYFTVSHLNRHLLKSPPKMHNI